jgi:hypothetical protein
VAAGSNNISSTAVINRFILANINTPVSDSTIVPNGGVYNKIIGSNPVFIAFCIGS